MVFFFLIFQKGHFSIRPLKIDIRVKMREQTPEEAATQAGEWTQRFILALPSSSLL